jgi:anthranilate 1,2-dioxygenase small subunit
MSETGAGTMTAAAHGRSIARDRIADLYSEYVHLIDDDRLEAWPELFTEPATYRVVTRENHDRGLPLALIYCAGRGMMADRISALRTANIYEPHVYCHMVSAVEVLEAAADGVRARSNFVVMRTMQGGDTMVFACGRSFDTIVEDGGRLRFAARTVVLDSRSIDTLLVIPL